MVNLTELPDFVEMNGSDILLLRNNTSLVEARPIAGSSEMWTKLYEWLFYFAFVVLAVAFVFNILSIVAIRFIRDELSPSLYLIVHLIVADTIMAASGLSYIAHSYVSEYLRVSTPNKRALQCSMHLNGHIWDTSTYASQLILLCLAADHLIAIKRPFVYRMILSRPRLHTMMTVVWLIAACLGWGAQFFIMRFDMESFNYRYTPAKGTTYYCYKIIVYKYHQLLTRDNTYDVSGVVISATVIIMSLVFMTTMYGLIFRHIVQMRLPEPSGKNRNRRSSFSANKKAIRTTLMLLGAFVFCYMPYFTWVVTSTFLDPNHLVSAVPDKTARRFINLAAVLLVSSNSLLDPIIYAARLRDVRGGYQRLKRILSNSPSLGRLDDCFVRWRFYSLRRKSRGSSSSGTSVVYLYSQRSNEGNSSTAKRYSSIGENCRDESSGVNKKQSEEVM